MFTTTSAASVLSCSPATVRRIAQRLGLGTLVRGAIVLSAEEIERIRPEIKPVGNPNMVPGNELWRPKRKSKKSAKRSR